ncbi:sulfurtransferase [Corynebacterium caspium]|uniref:sulfurtransferase n=1 Tax=Corynebacterium caspium TaxID=234828 RepID=UPI0004767F67|nr:sulfurtransferase [Corynebacterium caspium]WKD58644.1 3-mercaptopyruvate sulfurtransferase [Corynebacterium caspium DSM 44850]
MSLLISIDQLAEEIADGRGETLIACFWDGREGRGKARFQSHHIPTSVYCDPAYALSGIPSSRLGRNPLPDPAQLSRWFKQWGLNAEQPIIVYDEGHGIYAARAWWILKWAGLENIRILDGGQNAWDKSGRPLMGGPGNLPLSNNLRPNPGQLPVASIEEVKEFKGTLIDARGPHRFGGFREKLDLKAGHIPGAKNISTRDISHPDGRYLSVDGIREAFIKAGVDPETPGEDIIVYSGSGNHSAKLLAAMELIGITGAAHFVGGWSQWSADPRNPVQAGV